MLSGDDGGGGGRAVLELGGIWMVERMMTVNGGLRVGGDG